MKWVVRVELHDGPDPGAPASTVWRSFTREGARRNLITVLPEAFRRSGGVR